MCVSNDMRFDSRVEREASSLVSRGYAVIVLCRGRNGQLQHETRGGFHIHRVRLFSGSLPKQPLFWLIKYLEFVIRMTWLAWRYNADTYHAHNLDTLPSMYLAAKLRRSPIIYDSHELYTERPYVQFPQVWRRIEQWLLPRVDAVIAANIERALVMRDEYGATSIPTVLENCPPLQAPPQSSLLKDYAISQGRSWEHIVLYQGGIVPGRSAEVAIQAARRFPAKCGLVFLGSITDDYRQALLTLADQLGVLDRILFHRPVPYSDLLSYTASASIGLVLYENTCRNNYLCASNKLYEYLMTGLPVVASDFPPLARVVKSHDVGELVNPVDPAGIADAVCRLLESQTRLESIRKTAREISRQEFNWDHQALSLIKLYDSVNEDLSS